MQNNNNKKNILESIIVVDVMLYRKLISLKLFFKIKFDITLIRKQNNIKYTVDRDYIYIYEEGVQEKKNYLHTSWTIYYT